MTSLQLPRLARELTLNNRPAHLYRSCAREIARVLEIYDIPHLGVKQVRTSLRNHFYRHATVKDERVIHMLLEKGYMDLEDTLLQYKQRTQLLLILEGFTTTHHNLKQLKSDSTDEEKFQRWLE